MQHLRASTSRIVPVDELGINDLHIAPRLEGGFSSFARPMVQTLSMKSAYLLIVSLIAGFPAFARLDCKEQLKNRVFLTNWKFEMTRTYDPVFVEPFLQVHDMYPPPIRKWMCAISAFGIHPRLKVTAYSDYRFRQGLFEQDVDVDRWSTWKDQINFGIENDEKYGVDVQLPYYQSTLDRRLTFLYFSLLHEIAHNIETKFNSRIAPEWQILFNASFDRFKYKRRICFYSPEASRSCKSSGWSESQISDIYGDLYSQTDFLTLYGSTNPREDFAETFALYVMSLDKNFRYRLVVPHSKSPRHYDITELLKQDRYRKKMKLIADVYQSL